MRFATIILISLTFCGCCCEPSIGASSSAKFYNLGNDHYLADQLPEAIFAYRRGVRLNPNDQDMRANLDYARARVSYPFGERGRPEDDSWPSWLYRPSTFMILVMTMALYAMTCGLITRWFMTRRRMHLVRATLALVLGFACGFLWLHFVNENEWQDQHSLVVIREDKLPLRRGNGPSYPANPDLPILSRGMEARRMHERCGWLQIQFAGGEVGWVARSAVLVDEP